MSILVMLLFEPQKALGAKWQLENVLGKEARLLSAQASSSALPEPVSSSGLSGFHRPEQTSVPRLTRFLPACWKSSSLCLAGLTTHHSSGACPKTLRLSTQTVSTHSSAAACLPCFSSKPSRQDLGCSLALGLLVCHFTGHHWSLRPHPTTVVGAPHLAAGDSGLLFPALPAESRGRRQPAHKGESAQNDIGA